MPGARGERRNLSFGYAGELQLGQVFMFAAGAYVPMILAVRGVTSDVVLLMLIGGVVALLVGVLVAVPSLRIGGWSLAMASFFLVITIPDLTSILIKYTGGLNGLSGIPNPTLLGINLSVKGPFEVTAVVTVLWFACYRNLVTSRYGIVFRILRESPVLTKSLGFSTFRLKTSLYALGALPAGIAGCLYGFLTLVLEPTTYGLTLGIGIVAASLGPAQKLLRVLTASGRAWRHRLALTCHQQYRGEPAAPATPSHSSNPRTNSSAGPYLAASRASTACSSEPLFSSSAPRSQHHSRATHPSSTADF